MTRRPIKPIHEASTSWTEHPLSLLTAARLRRKETLAAQSAASLWFQFVFLLFFTRFSSYKDSTVHPNPFRSDHDFHRVVFLVRSTNAPKFQPYDFSQILEGEIKASFLPPRSAAPVLAMRSGSLYLTPGEYSLLSCSPLDLSTCWRLIARRKKQSGASRN